MLKLNDNPSLVLPGSENFADLKGDWWVAHTKPRCEKAFAWDLTHKQIPYFLPMAKRTQFSGGRRRVVMLPLFPSYVFLCGDDNARVDALTTGRTVNLLPVRDRARLINEIDSLKNALESNAELNLYPFAVIGRKVRVSRGPMMGTVGTVIQNAEVTKLVLQVTALGTAAEMTIDAAFLEDLG